MAELLRTIVGRLRAVVANRRRAPRRRLRLACSVSPHDPHPTKTNDSARPTTGPARRAPSLHCHTRDLSSTGLAVVAPAIRVGERYLSDASLLILLEHADGPIEIVAQPVRYERLAPDAEESGYLIGVRIVSMDDTDRARYEGWLARR